MTPFLTKLVRGEHLTREEAYQAFDRIMSGRPVSRSWRTFLGHGAEGEVVDELVGAAEVMRAKVTRVRCDDPMRSTPAERAAMDKHIQISTTAAVVAPRPAHGSEVTGNRSVTDSAGRRRCSRPRINVSETFPPSSDACASRIASCRGSTSSGDEVCGPVCERRWGFAPSSSVGPLTNPAMCAATAGSPATD